MRLRASPRARVVHLPQPLDLSVPMKLQDDCTPGASATLKRRTVQTICVEEEATATRGVERLDCVMACHVPRIVP